ncbi:MAG: alcohol dehydrogenase catalytic domain-containing protein [Deltaproteobacteria bacterium]|nr:alcohol dehydrogenase catalytic domain-containing protein [Deltaproteobacteria bacterium]
MKAVVVRNKDGFSGAEWESGVDIPAPEKGQVLIRMTYAPINPSDLVYAKGRYGIKGTLPFIPGLEGTGTVVDGCGYAKILKGRRVSCSSVPGGNGTWAEYMVTDASRCVPLLSGVSSEEGASMLINPVTAWGLCERVEKHKSDGVIVTQASGALGKMLMRLLVSRKIPVLGIVRKNTGQFFRNEVLREKIVFSNDNNFKKNIIDFSENYQKITILDGNGGKSTTQLLSILKVPSTVVVFGAMEGNSMNANPLDFIFNDHSIEGFWLKNYISGNRGISIAVKAFKIQHYLNDILHTDIQGIRKAEDFKLAIDEYKHNMSSGKILLSF